MNLALETFDRFYETTTPYRDWLAQSHGEWVLNYWTAQRTRYELLFETVRDLIKPGPEDRLLDVGVFPGFFTMTLCRMGLKVQAVDLSPERMEPYAGEAGLDVRHCNVDSESFPFPDASFDAVLFTAVLEHLRVNPIQTAREIRRVLKPGGRALVQTPNLGYWRCRLKVLLGRSFDESPTQAYARLENLGHPGHIRVYEMAELEELLEYAGFAVEARRWTHFGRRFPNSRGLLDRAFGVVPSMRRQLVVLARRTP